MNTIYNLDMPLLNELLVDGSNRAVITDSNHVTSLAKAFGGVFKHKIMKEKIISDHMSFMMEDRSNIFHKLFDRKMQQLVEAGIASKIIKDSTKVNFVDDSGQPEILTFNHIEIWITIWFLGVSVSVFAFLVEVLFKNKKKFVRTLLSLK